MLLFYGAVMHLVYFVPLNVKRNVCARAQSSGSPWGAQAFNTGNNNKPFSLAPQSIKKLNRQSRTSLENYLISSSLAWRAGPRLSSREQQSHTQTHSCSRLHIIPSANSLPTANSMGGFKNSFPSSQTYMRGGKKVHVSVSSLSHALTRRKWDALWGKEGAINI